MLFCVTLMKMSVMRAMNITHHQIVRVKLAQ